MSTVPGTENENSGAASTARPISDLTYRSYDGPLQTHALRWWTVAAATIRTNVNRQRLWYWLPAGLTFLVYLIHAAYFYFDRGLRERAAALTGEALPVEWRGNPFAAELYDGMSYPLVELALFLAAVIVGASSIAADNRANALLVYLSRPFTRFDYLFGKWAGIFILLASLTLVPSLLLFLFFIGVYGGLDFLKQNPTLILRMFFAGLIPALIHSSLIVGFSARTRSSRLAGANYAAVYLVSGAVVLSLGMALWLNDVQGKTIDRTSIVVHSSVDGIQNGLMQHIYQVQPAPPFNWKKATTFRDKRRKSGKNKENRRIVDVLPEQLPERPPLWASLTLGSLIVVIPLAVAWRKVKAVEVVNG